MFDSSYSFSYRGKRKAYTSELFVAKHLLRFKGKGNHTYIVEVEEYSGNLFVVKFYLKSHRLSPDKFSLLTGNKDMPGIIRTCINIMLYFYQRCPDASFAFMGQPGEHESTALTQRFRIYRSVMYNFFSPVKFIHYSLELVSAYLLLNRSSALTLEQIEVQFKPMFSPTPPLGA